MVTNKRKVATYLSPELCKWLKVFMDHKGINSESKALTTILEEYFGRDELTETATSIERAIAEAIESHPTIQRLTALVERVEELEQSLRPKAKTEQLDIFTGLGDFMKRTHEKYYGDRNT